MTPIANSIGALVAAKDKAAGDRVVAAINDAIKKVKEMPAPFRDNLEWSAANEAARDAVAEVEAALVAAQAIL